MEKIYFLKQGKNTISRNKNLCLVFDTDRSYRTKTVQNLLVIFFIRYNKYFYYKMLILIMLENLASKYINLMRILAVILKNVRKYNFFQIT